jgi:hypothetical protein
MENESLELEYESFETKSDSESRSDDLPTDDRPDDLPADGGSEGDFRDQADTEWIVIRTQLRGHNDTPFGRPTPGRPVGRQGVGRP